MGVLWTGDEQLKCRPPVGSEAIKAGEGAEGPRKRPDTPVLDPRSSSLEIIYQLVIATLLGILAGLIAWVIATGVGFQG